MNANIQISSATIADALTITTLSVLTFVETFAATNSKEDMDKYLADEMNEQKIAAELAEDTNFFFLASIDNQPVGFLKLRTGPNPDAPTNCNPVEIERLYVLQQYQSMKAGVALMQHAINFAQQHNYSVIWLGVWEHNHKALHFYQKWGFTEYSTHPFILGNDVQTDLLMKKGVTTR